LDDYALLKKEWRRLFDLTRPQAPDNVERLVPR
jgi:hypothetical protein